MSVFVTIVRLGLLCDRPLGASVTLYLTILVFTAIYRHNSSQPILDCSLPQMLWYTAASGFIWF